MVRARNAKGKFRIENGAYVLERTEGVIEPFIAAYGAPAERLSPEPTRSAEEIAADQLRFKQAAEEKRARKAARRLRNV